MSSELLGSLERGIEREQIERKSARVVADRVDRTGDDARRSRLGDPAAVPDRVSSPAGKGFYDWLVQPPLLVIPVGLFFALAIAPGLVDDLRGDGMTPRAELVHWLFAAGFLLLGLILLAEAIVGREVWRSDAGGRTCGRRSRSGSASLLWPVSVFFTNSTLAHGRARVLGGDRDDRRRGPARARARQADEPLVDARRLRVDGGQRARVPDPRAEPVALLARRLPPSRARLDGPRRRDLPDRPDAPATRVRLERRFRDDLGHGRRPALLRPRPRSDLRPSVTARGRAEMRRRAVFGAAALVAVALPATAFGHATLRHASPAFQSRENVAPRQVLLRFDQTVGIIPHTIEVFTSDGRRVSGTPTFGGQSSRRTCADHRPRAGRLHRALARVCPPTVTSARGYSPSAIGVTPPPPTEAYGASGPTWADDFARWALFVSLALLLGSLGVRLLVLREPVPERLSKRLYLFSGLGAFAAIDVGIAAFILRAEDALQLPFVDLLYGDLSPFATKTRFGVRSSR